MPDADDRPDDEQAERLRAFKMVDSAPPEIRALIHEYDLHDLVEVAKLVGIQDVKSLRRGLERNRRLEQERREQEAFGPQTG